MGGLTDTLMAGRYPSRASGGDGEPSAWAGGSSKETGRLEGKGEEETGLEGLLVNARLFTFQLLLPSLMLPHFDISHWRTGFPWPPLWLCQNTLPWQDGQENSGGSPRAASPDTFLPWALPLSMELNKAPSISS